MKLDITIKEIEDEQYLCIKLSDLTQLKRKRVNFKPPTIEQVREYCKERRNKVNVSQFMNHYESNGWMVGKNKMKSWQAAVRTWEGNTPEPTGRDIRLELPPEIFGVRNPNATNMPESLKKKFGIK